MNRLAAIAAVAAGLALPVLAQHGVARSGGGFSAPHVSAPVSGPRGGFVPPSMAPRGSFGGLPGRPVAPAAGIGIRPAPRGFPNNPTLYRYVPRTQPSAYRPFYPRSAAPAHWHGHDGDWDHNHHRAVYWYGSVYPYSYGYGAYPIFTGYVNPWLFGNCWSSWYGWSAWCDADGYSSYNSSGDIPAPYREYGTDSGSGPYPQQYYPDQPTQPQGQPQTEPQPQPARPDYAPSSAPAAALHPQTVTVIYNDGRPPEHIQNYLLTAHTLTVFDTKYREIPLTQVNLAATLQANRAAGVEFRVPAPQ